MTEDQGSKVSRIIQCSCCKSDVEIILDRPAEILQATHAEKAFTPLEHIKAIAELAADYFGCKVDQIFGPFVSRLVARARYLLFWLIRQVDPRLNDSDMARLTNKNRTIIPTGCGVTESEYRKNPLFAAACRDLAEKANILYYQPFQ